MFFKKNKIEVKEDKPPLSTIALSRNDTVGSMPMAQNQAKRVKQLIWYETDEIIYSSPIIFKIENFKGLWCICANYLNIDETCFHDLEQAKEVCQKHFEKLVLTSLE